MRSFSHATVDCTAAVATVFDPRQQTQLAADGYSPDAHKPR